MSLKDYLVINGNHAKLEIPPGVLGARETVVINNVAYVITPSAMLEAIPLVAFDKMIEQCDAESAKVAEKRALIQAIKAEASAPKIEVVK